MPRTTTAQASHGATARTVGASHSLDRIRGWELLRSIGHGSLTHVYQARPKGAPADRPACYALKALHPEFQNDPSALATLAREMHVSRKLSHPHLAPILAGQLEEPPYYLVMPLLEGWTLGQRLCQAEPIDLPIAFWSARQVAEALAALHKAGWIHADVKPNNIFLSPTGHVTLIDLGFARHVEERVTLGSRAVLGTMQYMAPEVLCSTHGGDASSDVYSLGVTLFELLTGRLPFDADDVAELAAQHRQELPIDLRALVPHLPIRAARLVRQMLSKEPMRRPSTSDVIERLAALEIETFAERHLAN